MDTELLHRRAADASHLLRALGNPHRLLVICELMDGERSVGDLVRRIGLSQSALSQHLARLRRDHLVRTRRCAQTIYYSVNGPQARAVLETLQRLFADPEVPGHRPVPVVATASANDRHVAL